MTMSPEPPSLRPRPSSHATRAEKWECRLWDISHTDGRTDGELVVLGKYGRAWQCWHWLESDDDTTLNFSQLSNSLCRSPSSSSIQYSVYISNTQTVEIFVRRLLVSSLSLLGSTYILLTALLQWCYSTLCEFYYIDLLLSILVVYSLYSVVMLDIDLYFFFLCDSFFVYSCWPPLPLVISQVSTGPYRFCALIHPSPNPMHSYYYYDYYSRWTILI